MKTAKLFICKPNSAPREHEYPIPFVAYEDLQQSVNQLCQDEQWIRKGLRVHNGAPVLSPVHLPNDDPVKLDLHVTEQPGEPPCLVVLESAPLLQTSQNLAQSPWPVWPPRTCWVSWLAQAYCWRAALGIVQTGVAAPTYTTNQQPWLSIKSTVVDRGFAV